MRGIKLTQVMVYKQVRKDGLGRFKERLDFVGDINTRSPDRKRIMGRTPRSMAKLLAINLKRMEANGMKLTEDIRGLETVIRTGGFVSDGDDILPLEPQEIREVQLSLAMNGILSADG